MLFLASFLVGAYVFLYAFALVVPALVDEQRPLGPSVDLVSSFSPSKQHSELEQWLEDEEKIAVDRLLANIAPYGRNAQDAVPGTVLASPSRSHPNYYFQWIRDAAITMSTVTTLYARAPFSYLSTSVLLPTLEAYASLSAQLQRTPNPSGDFSFPDLPGLGEPKFHVDGSSFSENWGRPQRDGPALRATALMAFVRAWNESHPGAWEARGVSKEGEGNEGEDWFAPLYSPELPATSTIKADLEYVARHWRAYDSFDVWEEIQGRHFFTLMAQLRALREGADLAVRFGDHGAAAWYALQAGEAAQVLAREFWDEEVGWLRATRGGRAERDRGGLDCATLLGAVWANPAAPTTDGAGLWPPVFPPHDDAVLATLRAMVLDMKARYPINGQHDGSTNADGAATAFGAAALGRYPEDAYDGYSSPGPDAGNPWFLCTAVGAEVLFLTAAHAEREGVIRATGRGRAFWSDVLCSSPSSFDEVVAINATSPLFEHALARLRETGDGFLDVVRRHASKEGALSEQFGRWDGFEQGASDLTWSYGALLGAGWARRMGGV
ncbi:glycoside hydrolase family 15 protein [Aplosporella prunicola CBS 121167]|uniref:glucan 1,4-alpha-glucosidase n=1 Tax=Aplosporella prunicola CBS 121167 TaxID=1176127 RepID=A0A6A6BKK1_9PEZI|nr:glycoside hydrolase family 15 protein [Aplosporella prunicola CBS 121167]KAF2143913.1 glycoside hydrolase family 15 protein [Aplosporella prunicola CBS 121167]